MKILLATALLIMSTGLMAQTGNFDISKDPKNGELTYKGQITFDDLLREPSFTWLSNGTEEYKPEEKQLTILKEQLPSYSIVLFLGTWCDDSHYLVPKLKKILQLINYPLAQITLWGVDRDKTTKGGVEKSYNITLVPTIILFKDGVEKGRITETVQKSVEADLASIIMK